MSNSGGGLFGNGQTNLADLFGFAIIASMFPNLFGGYGYGNRGGQCGGCQCPSVDGQLALQAVAAQGDASRAAIENLAASMGQNYNTTRRSRAKHVAGSGHGALPELPLRHQGLNE